MRKILLSLFSMALATSAMMAQECVVTAGKWQVTANETTGKVTIVYGDETIVSGNEAEWGLRDAKKTFASLTDIAVSHNDYQDEFGSGKQLIVSGMTTQAPTTKITHTYYIYSDRDYILTDVVLEGNEQLEINYIAPIRSTGSANILDAGTNYFLYVPFDNDGWTRYETRKFGEHHPTCYEVSVFFNNDSRRGLVTGSIEHDTWKTGVSSETTGETTLKWLTVFNGVTSKGGTRDNDPHGAVKARRVESSKMMIGYFTDWRRGMETYADLCAIVHPQLPFRGEKPFGWNSWGVLQTNIKPQYAIEVSDYFADVLAPAGFVGADGVVYIGLDSWWNENFGVRDHGKFVKNCAENNQYAGIYWTPFADWGKNESGVMPSGGAGNYTWGDAWLRDSNGNPQELDGAIALDPTHPATLGRIKAEFEKYLKWGYKFVKLDFMTHGALEGKHYDESVQTGLQAYNKAMEYIASFAGDSMFINLSIAPLFPAHHAHGRRIACDAFSSLGNAEYTLNSTGYGWWLDHCYSYNDADHVVLSGQTITINRVRLTSSYITGSVILGDDLSAGGDSEAKKRLEELAGNKEVVAMAHQTKAFYPVEAKQGHPAPNLFMYEVADTVYLAALNYESGRRYDFTIDFDRLGLTTGTEYVVRELWTGHDVLATESFEETVRRADASIYKIYPKPIDNSVEGVPCNETRCYYDGLAGEVRMKGSSYLVESYVYTVGGTCVYATHESHDTVDVNHLPAGAYFYRGLDAEGNSIVCKFVK